MDLTEIEKLKIPDELRVKVTDIFLKPEQMLEKLENFQKFEKENRERLKNMMVQIEERQKIFENFNHSEPFCLSCFKQNIELKKCEICEVAFYCSVKCEKNDYKNHKEYCPPTKEDEEEQEL